MAERTNSSGNFLFDDRIIKMEEKRKNIQWIQDPKGSLFTLLQGTLLRVERATSAPVCKRQNLIKIIPSPPGQVSMPRCEASPVCTAVWEVGPPAGKLTLWSTICDKAPIGEARYMAPYEMDFLWVLQQIRPLQWCVHGLAIRHDFWMGSYGLLVTWLCKLIYAKLYCSNLYEVKSECLQREGVDNLFPIVS